VSVLEIFDSGRSLLSPRQLEVVQGLRHGLSYREIAGELGISASTVENYMRFARYRLRARTNVEAIAEAIGRGLIQ
jgi:DNA-binding NarL/FixJ family response regulator